MRTSFTAVVVICVLGTKRCTVVYGHHPYRSSAAPYTGQPDLSAIWPTLVLGRRPRRGADHRGRDRGRSLIPFGQVSPASRVGIAGRYGILKIVPDHPAKDRWIHAFKGHRRLDPGPGRDGCH